MKVWARWEAAISMKKLPPTSSCRKNTGSDSSTVVTYIKTMSFFYGAFSAAGVSGEQTRRDGVIVGSGWGRVLAERSKLAHASVGLLRGDWAGFIAAGFLDRFHRLLLHHGAFLSCQLLQLLLLFLNFLLQDASKFFGSDVLFLHHFPLFIEPVLLHPGFQLLVFLLRFEYFEVERIDGLIHLEQVIVLLDPWFLQLLDLISVELVLVLFKDAFIFTVEPQQFLIPLLELCDFYNVPGSGVAQCPRVPAALVGFPILRLHPAIIASALY